MFKFEYSYLLMQFSFDVVWLIVRIIDVGTVDTTGRHWDASLVDEGICCAWFLSLTLIFSKLFFIHIRRQNWIKHLRAIIRYFTIIFQWISKSIKCLIDLIINITIRYMFRSLLIHNLHQISSRAHRVLIPPLTIFLDVNPPQIYFRILIQILKKPIFRQNWSRRFVNLLFWLKFLRLGF